MLSRSKRSIGYLQGGEYCEGFIGAKIYSAEGHSRSQEFWLCIRDRGTQILIGVNFPLKTIQAANWPPRIYRLSNEYTKDFVGITIINTMYSIMSMCLVL